MRDRRYLVEIGMGVDLHGGDLTKAARRAVKDAVSRCCLCGILEILGIEDPSDTMRVEVLIAAAAPEKVDLEQVAREIPFGHARVTAVAGGLEACGVHVASLGPGNQIQVVNAALTVWIGEEALGAHRFPGKPRL